MSTFVIDASVAIKWVLPEVHTDLALRLLDLPHELCAPDLFFGEVASIVWKRVRWQQLDSDSAGRLIDTIAEFSVTTFPSQQLIADALSIAVSAGRTLYDSLYLALASRLNTRLITADERLLNGVAGLPRLAAHVQLLTTFFS